MADTALSALTATTTLASGDLLYVVDAGSSRKIEWASVLANLSVTESQVTAAGALMDSEVTNLADVKAFDPADYATTAQGSTADTAVQPGDDADVLGSGAANDGQVLTADGAGGAAWEDATGGSGGTVDVVSNVAALRGLTGQDDGQVARVVDNRQLGYFKWAAGDMSAFITLDPYGGIYVAPTAAPTGASGAWVRQIEKAEYDAEWWLPDTMPSDAQTYINSGILALPENQGTFLLPRRQTNLTGSLRFMKGLHYKGFGRDAPMDGNGGNFFAVEIGASNSRLSGISAGNVAGQLVYGEPGGFHVYDGDDYWQNETAVENVSATDCHAYDGETGFRAGLGVFVVGGQTPGPDSDVTLYPSRDIYLENFTADGIERIGIECMRANGVEVRGGKVQMAVPESLIGFDRGVRVAGSWNVHISGVHVVAPDSTTVRGVSVENASQGGTTFGGSVNVSVENVTVEDCDVGLSVKGGFSRKISFAGNRIIGRRNTYNGPAFIVNGDATPDGYELEQTPLLNIKIKDNVAVNVGYFLNADGHVYDATIEGNSFTSNESTDFPSQFFIVAQSGTEKKFIDWLVKGNRAYTSGVSTTGTIRMLNIHADSDITFDDNEFTADADGDVFTISGDATIRLGINRTIPAGKWALARPPLDQADYPQGDFGLIRNAD